MLKNCIIWLVKKEKAALIGGFNASGGLRYNL
jgi:hypothetical protein